MSYINFYRIIKIKYQWLNVRGNKYVVLFIVKNKVFFDEYSHTQFSIRVACEYISSHVFWDKGRVNAKVYKDILRLFDFFNYV
uniref:Uncharacterized protein n=1 Tax=Oryza brachyantha TaxID=4533 RepID=J3LWI4_ORYBR